MTIAMNGISRSTLSALVLAALTSCGGSGYGGDDGGGGGTTYTVGGMVTGLAGSGLVLQNNGSGDLAVSSDGAFTFPTGLSVGAAYAVTVNTQPSSPTQNCVITGGSGTVATSNVTNVSVVCSTSATFTVGGSVTELEGSGLVLQNNSGDDLSVSASGAFTFAAGVADGADYTVTVKTQPSSPAQTCLVGNFAGGSGTGTIDSANVENIWIACRLHFAYAANAGDDTLSSYVMDPFTGTLAAVGTPIATGASPFAITGSPDKRHVYVVNRDGDDISAYAVNATTGALTEIAGSPFATGADPQALAFDPSGAYLYVADHGSSDLSAYAVDVGSGALTPLSPAIYATGAGPSSVAVDPSGDFVYVANNGGTNDISVFAITAGTGALTPVAGSPFAAGDSPHGLAVGSSLATTHVYTANNGGVASTISAFSVNPSTGALTAVAGSPFDVSISHYIAVYSGYGDSLFVTSGDSVVGYLNLPAGLQTSIPGYSAATGVNAFSVTIASSVIPYLYVGNDGGASISAYRIDDVGGILTAVPGSPFAAGNNPDFIAIL